MNSLEGETWSHGNLKIHGLSLSGVRTCLCLPQFQIAFDVAQGLPFAMNMKKFFITHGHMDHAAGIPYIISQKALNSSPPPDFYMPESLLDPFYKMIKIWESIEGHEYQYQFHGINENSSIWINANYWVKPFLTDHRIPSFGYALVHTKKKLKPEWSHLSKNEILELKNQSVEIEDHIETIEWAFSGDTRIEFLQMNPWLKDAKILCLESTYLDDERDIDHARKWGHTHLNEIILHLDSLKCEKILLLHLSSRYSLKKAQEIIKAKIPQHHQERVVLFAGQ